MFKSKQRLRILDEGWDRLTDLFLKQQKEISALKDTSIKVGDKVMLKKDMTKVYEVERISEGQSLSAMVICYGVDAVVRKHMEASKDYYILSGSRKNYTQDQILPYREDSHLLAKEIKKLKK